MAPKRAGGGVAKAKSVADVQASLNSQVQQLEGLLVGSEKKVKDLSLAFNNSIFKKAQEAFERCEGINQQSDEMRDQAAGDHAAKKKELGARRQALGRKVAASASAMAELRAVQEEAAQVFAQLRAKMIAAPYGTGGGGGGGGDKQAAKRRKGVTFGGKAA